MVDDGPVAVKNENFTGFEGRKHSFVCRSTPSNIIEIFNIKGLAPAIKEILESQPSSSTETSKQRSSRKRNRSSKLSASTDTTQLSANETSKIPKRSVCLRMNMFCCRLRKK